MISRLFLALIGGIAVGAIVLVLCAALFIGLAPRRVPIAFFLLPFMGFFWGAVIGYNYATFFRDTRRVIDDASSSVRLWFAFGVLWMCVVVVVFLVFTPFGRYHDVTSWSGHDWFKFLTILLGPVVVGLLGLQLFSWATRSQITKHSGKTAVSEGTQSGPPLNLHQTIAKAVADGDITPAYGIQIAKRYEELLQKTGDSKPARLLLIDEMEQEVLRRKARRELGYPD